jgi:Tfp pilus assembly protein PilW
MNVKGYSLLETLLAMFLTMIALLAVAPMFVHASRGNEAGADMGSVGAIALDQVEQLTQLPWRDLEPGGSLTEDVAGYLCAAVSEFLVRWTIAAVPNASHSRAITVVAVARDGRVVPRRRAELTVIRGR